MTEHLTNSIHRLFCHFVTQWLDRKHYKRSMKELNRLDDHLLADIGMSRVNGRIVSNKTTGLDQRPDSDSAAINGVRENQKRQDHKACWPRQLSPTRR